MRTNRPFKLQELRDKISAERRFVDKKPYSHNIISLLLSQISHEFSQQEANAAIRELKLKPLGWNEVEITSAAAAPRER